jgi:hypothetical protein
MSHPNEPSDASKPVLRDKNPHNYRKVGYSMIVISVSLVLIGLLVMTMGQNYHFSGDLMAGQEIASMTPKGGYDLVIFDYTQPVGAKMQLQSHVDDLAHAQELKTQLEKEHLNQKGMALIFDASPKDNVDSVSLAEVFAMTPSYGYNIISFNDAFPAGAKLSSLKLDSNFTDAQKDSQSSSDQVTDPKIHIVTFSVSFEDNLKQILGSKYNPDLVSSNINQFKTMSPKLIVPKPESPTLSGANQTTIPLQNSTTTNPINSTSSTNSTASTNSTNTNSTAITNSTTNTNSTTHTGENVGKLSNGTNVIYNSTHTKTIAVSENLGIKSQ